MQNPNFSNHKIIFTNILLNQFSITRISSLYDV